MGLSRSFSIHAHFAPSLQEISLFWLEKGDWLLAEIGHQDSPMPYSAKGTIHSEQQLRGAGLVSAIISPGPGIAKVSLYASYAKMSSEPHQGLIENLTVFPPWLET